MSTINLLIKGKVQGVYYRNAAKEEADKLGITGWVKYNNDGKVEIMATGNEASLEQFTAWCHTGSEKAVVSNVIVTPLSDQAFDEFTVIHEKYPHDL